MANTGNSVRDSTFPDPKKRTGSRSSYGSFKRDHFNASGQPSGSLINAPTETCLGGGSEDEQHGLQDQLGPTKSRTSVAEPSIEKNTRKWYHPKALLLLAISNWFLIGIGIAIGLASRFPQVAAEGGYIRSEYSIQYGALAIIFLITGLTLSTQILYRQVKSYSLHLSTQIISLLVFPTVVFIIITIIQSADNPAIDRYILVGLMVMGVLPTTVASNITMTRGADGNVEAATVEVVVGQILGIFLSPLLLNMFFVGSSWAYGRPVAEAGKKGTAGLTAIYQQVGKRLGLAVFLPTFVGQVIQNIGNARKYIKWATTHLHLPKIATFMLLLIIWSAFSNQFKNHAFESISPQSVILVCFFNLSLYLCMTLAVLYICRLPYLTRSITHPPMASARWRRKLANFILHYRFAKPETTAICFCAPAKGLTVGSPILNILYAGFPEDKRAIISIPIVIYQGQQVAAAQILTYLFKRWNAKPDTLVANKDPPPELPTSRAGTPELQDRASSVPP
ncbi:SBF-like CPA transporter family-domain-containing protein [Kockovaella imperatae]|uniref:SBF-like CPA transporter family-domain-containing protein n=1 Tax=Kockovaella imperatae TaxID=4999 RepID=A0A1Y1URA9_9TREE|nr:SBF-like CPA transporter family-domain-containing protein [Kockovaella imperatae]ORX40601.1 SBF-like CPA transporter family-domain-containing protein [Kockovaella imperatae]